MNKISDAVQAEDILSVTISFETQILLYSCTCSGQDGVKEYSSKMMLKIGLLILCVCGPYLRAAEAVPIEEEDDVNGRSYKRELELLTNEVQDNWEHDDNEYLSPRELDEKKNAMKSKESDTNEEETKRWLNVDSDADGLNEQPSPADEEELPKDGEIFQGDIVMDTFVREVFNGEAAKRDAVNLEKYYWPKGIIHYEFDRNIDNISRRQILKAIRYYHEYTCIKFIPKSRYDNVEDYVRFISNGSACYSNVGRRGGMQKVSIGSGCYRVGTPIHEMMHVLGFFHEMARPDRDSSVLIHWSNIKDGMAHNFRKMPKSIDLNLGIKYNRNSVLQYSNGAFSKNGEDTISAINDPAERFGQRCGFSVGDVIQINKLYNCPRLNSRFKHAKITDLLCKDEDMYTVSE